MTTTRSVLVAGIDSSTQSCKVVVRDAESGRLVRRGAAPHPPGTEVDPSAWWQALAQAIDAAGGLDDVAAVSVGGQQHGLICLDEDSRVVRPALLWNDTRSAQAAADLIAELGCGDVVQGARAWAAGVGTVPVASITATKLRWLVEHEPDNAQRVAAVALPHDWLTWRLAGSASLESLVTDRSEASGTGYFDAVSNEYRADLLAMAMHRSVEAIPVLPRVSGPHESIGQSDPANGRGTFVLGPGCGDNAGAALGIGLVPGEASVSIGTSGVVAAVSNHPTSDPSGIVAGFASATGDYLPLAVTINAARVLDSTARLLGRDHDGLARLALSAEPGAGGLVCVPYLDGERTPNLPNARGELHRMTTENLTPENLARAAVEGLLAHLGQAIAGMRALGNPIDRVVLVGGGARSEAIRRLAPAVWGIPVEVSEPSEDVADGAARQAAWVLAGGDEPPPWTHRTATTFEAEHLPQIQSAYDEVVATVAKRAEE